MTTDRITITVNGVALAAERGALISDVLMPEHGVTLGCGGRGICRKCRVQAFGALSTPTAEELACLSEQERQAGYRLACCARMEGPCRIHTNAIGGSRICADGVMPSFFAIPPVGSRQNPPFCLKFPHIRRAAACCRRKTPHQSASPQGEALKKGKARLKVVSNKPV